MDEKEFKKNKDAIEKYIEKNILTVPNFIGFRIHRLPDYVKEDSEYIFKIKSNLDVSQKKYLLDVIYQNLFKCYDDLNLEEDFIVILTEN